MDKPLLLTPGRAGAETTGYRLEVRKRLRDPRFWLVQSLVLAVTVNHFFLEFFEPFHLHAMYFVPASLYLFPVLYASLKFGTAGAIPTAIWSALLAMPNVLFLHHGLEAVGETLQVLAMLVLATVVALHVEQERLAREAAEDAEQERRWSEQKYRSLFDAASEAILVVDAQGIVREANAAADELVRAVHGEPAGQYLTAVLGTQAQPIVRRILGEQADLADLSLPASDGTEMWLEPRLSQVSSGPEMLTQVLLRDVTDRRGFQHYAREVLRAQEAERQWIAQELHDVSVQSAILICRRLDAAAEAVEGSTHEVVLQELDHARTTAETMADELRSFSRDLRPLILEDLGLVPALKRLALEIEDRAHIRARFQVHGAVRRLDRSVELALFRIAQEGMRNAERHSGASMITLSLSIRPRLTRLSVADNGSGFEQPALTTLVHSRKLGLLGMQERARLVGGRCEITSTPGHGTVVSVEVANSEVVGPALPPRPPHSSPARNSRPIDPSNATYWPNHDQRASEKLPASRTGGPNVLKGLRDRLLELLDAPSGRVETRGTVLDANGVLWRLAFDDKSPQTGDWKRGERAEVEGRVLDTDEPTLLVRRFFRFS